MGGRCAWIVDGNTVSSRVWKRWLWEVCFCNASILIPFLYGKSRDMRRLLTC